MIALHTRIELPQKFDDHVCAVILKLLSVRLSRSLTIVSSPFFPLGAPMTAIFQRRGRNASRVWRHRERRAGAEMGAPWLRERGAGERRGRRQGGRL